MSDTTFPEVRIYNSGYDAGRRDGREQAYSEHREELAILREKVAYYERLMSKVAEGEALLQPPPVIKIEGEAAKAIEAMRSERRYQIIAVDEAVHAEHDRCQRLCQDAVTEATNAERERCAKIAEDVEQIGKLIAAKGLPDWVGSDDREIVEATSEVIAQLIANEIRGGE